MRATRAVTVGAALCLALATLGLVCWTPVPLDLSAVTGAGAEDASLPPGRAEF